MTNKRKTGRKPAISKVNKEMVRLYMSDPTITKTQAYKATHKVSPETKLTSIYQQAAQTFNNPIVKKELAKYDELFEDTIVSAVQDYKDSSKQWERTLAVETSKWGHDKVHGKAVQQIQQTTTGITISVDLTNSLTAE